MKLQAMVKKAQALVLCCLCKGTGFEVNYTDNQAVSFRYLDESVVVFDTVVLVNNKI